MNKGTAANVDEYIKSFPGPTRKKLNQIREAIKKAAPGAAELISYQMPAYKLDGALVYFAGCNNHIGFYPTNTGVSAFQKELSPYVTSKGAVQFPYEKPLPLGLIRDIVKFRVQENREKSAGKKKVTKSPLKQKPTTANDIEAWMKNLEAPTRKNINAIRKIIRNVSADIRERIKWNAPSYHFKEKDFLTFGPSKDQRILLVFHHPGIEKIKSPLLEGNYKHRRLLYLGNAGEIRKHEKELTRIITQSLEKI